MQPKIVAIRKRTQIASANRMMFIWVAIVSVLFSISLVAAVFLVQILIFNEKVLHQKGITVSTLDSNYKNITDPKDGLQNKIRVLDTNSALMSIKAKPDDQALQVILDALPSEANSLALGASLQNKLLFGINGLSIDSLSVDPVVGVESLTDTSVVNASPTYSSNQITFRFSVSGNQTALKQVLVNLEKSIRTIDIMSLKIESQGTSQMLSVQARAFYEPARDVKLREMTVK